ncbi:PRADC1-like protein [Phlebotomus argentipes]|uniref:PRADC1-like protein n=1 Tax=Phlebotomus argentipes TaxID=94469 RepID=UPI002892A998|nr:PRADC1-like protein [Phlebotomus argentipes]
MVNYVDLILILLVALVLLACDIDFANCGGNLHMLDSVTTQDIIAGDVFFEVLDPAELEYTYRLRPAKDFGAPFNASFHFPRIALVPVVPFDACSRSAIKNGEDLEGNVALVERGDCSFLTKTINVERHGALAAIITESNTSEAEEDEYYIEMVHDNTGRDANIPAGFLIGINGRIILQTLKKMRRNYAIISIPVNLTFTPPHQINHPPWLGW